MLDLRHLVLDQWAPLSHKAALDRPHTLAPTWVPKRDLRRLAAYKLLRAYKDNVARFHLRTTDLTQRDSRREYGDPELLIERVVAGVLGDELSIVIDGADADLPDAPVLPDEPEPAEGAEGIARSSLEAQRRVWERRATEAIAEWEEAWATQPELQARQQWLRDWADGVLLHQKAWECENDAVGMGDGVYVLGLSSRGVSLDVYDPGFYFPVLDDAAAELGFPTTVHLVWEVDEDDDGVTDHVRRITWRLGPIATVTDERGRGINQPDGSPLLLEGDTYDPGRGPVRTYPWDLTEVSTQTCFMTDATWSLRDLSGAIVKDFDPVRARYALNEDGLQIRNLDLRIDFIPVVHRPNTPAGHDHFGRSMLSRVLQLLDDIAETDTALQEAASLAGTPMAVVSGASVPAAMVIEPGAVYGVGENGRMDVVDMSASVEVLRHVIDDLLNRFSVNSQVPAEVMGRVDSMREAPSGVSRALTFGPFRSLIAVLRLTREPKDALLLKFVQRMAQAGQLLEPGPTMPARLVFGSFLPADRKGVIDEVVALLSAKAISRSTALRMLQAAGVEFEDIAAEVARIESTDFAGANELMDAVNDENAARAYLGMSGASSNPTEPPPPAPRLGPDGLPIIDLP